MTICVEDVCKAYNGRKVLDHFSIDLEEGKIYALEGPEGSGKTTLIRILLGLEEPDAGRIRFMGDYKYSSLGYGVVFQENRLLEACSAAENVAMVHKNTTIKSAIHFLSPFLSEDRAKLPVQQLNEAEKRMVSIVRAFSVPSDLIFMDEPFSAFTEEERNRVVAYMEKKINKRPLLIVTRDASGLNFARKVRIG